MKVDHILLAAGGYELYVDDIVAFADLIGAEQRYGAPKRLVVCPKEVHAQALIDRGLGLQDGIMSNELTKWFRDIRFGGAPR